jgi:hypothetical protein
MNLIVARPDMMYGMTLISRLMEIPKESHWDAGKIISRYVNGTKYFGIMYSTSENFRLIGYTDSDDGGSVDDRKITSRYTFHFGTCILSWESRNQPIVTLYSTEVEYVAATRASCQAFWMRRMLKDFFSEHHEPFCDNNSAIMLSKNHVFHEKTKHIDTRYHFIREFVSNK